MRGKDFNTGLRGSLFEAKHYERMGAAVWLYGWLILRQTRQASGVGLVLGGAAVSYREIEEETGFARKTLERWMRVLRECGYIETTAAPAGVIIRITKAKKFTSGSAASGATANAGESSAAPPAKMRQPPPQAEGGPPRFWGADAGKDLSRTPIAGGIGSSIPIREIEKQPSAATENPQKAENEIPKIAGGNGGSWGWRALRARDVRRETRVGEGPSGSY